MAHNFKKVQSTAISKPIASIFRCAAPYLLFPCGLLKILRSSAACFKYNLKTPLLLIVLFLFSFQFGIAQVANGLLKCNNETFKLLKEVSASPASKGEILLSITTHQDLGWVDEVEKCIMLRDTLWLIPFLERLKHEPDFKMDIEQTSIIME